MAKHFLDFGRIEWDSQGRAKWRHHREYPCPGPPGFRECEGTYTDDYGSLASCRECQGRGAVAVIRYIRLPQYDVTKRPRKNWKPTKKLLDEAYKV
jgi:hypothetical protein